MYMYSYRGVMFKILIDEIMSFSDTALSVIEGVGNHRLYNKNM